MRILILHFYIGLSFQSVLLQPQSWESVRMKTRTPEIGI
jgi:hypothetical protein